MTHSIYSKNSSTGKGLNLKKKEELKLFRITTCLTLFTVQDCCIVELLSFSVSDIMCIVASIIIFLFIYGILGF